MPVSQFTAIGNITLKFMIVKDIIILNLKKFLDIFIFIRYIINYDSFK